MILKRLFIKLIYMIVIAFSLFAVTYYFSEGKIGNLVFDPTTAKRLHRIVFIRQEVEKKLNRDSYVAIADIPESMQQAVIAVEDSRFYSHKGFDIEGIGRAALVNLQYGEVVEGASTITQQLVKNLFLSQEQTYGRKAEELILALDLEARYSKDEILEMYLNSIYFGSGYYGVKDAAKGYFNKPVSQLALPEVSMLAGIPNAPSVYSPHVNYNLAKKRQVIVLDAMVRCEYVRENIAEDAKIKPLYITPANK